MVPVEPKISVEYRGKTAIVSFTEEKILEDKDIQAIDSSITAVLEQSEQICMVLDFCNVRFLSSAVLGLLIRLSKKIYEKEGRLMLCGIDTKIYEIFKITRLTKVFDIYDDVESAVDSINL